ncbi:DNA-directed RNA polymerase sigma-70 factor [Cytophagales bacterium WSM2-2]|nr:DNA-directed RNA polymerase sigma-70 factor [Cytophagales bacterium WSM2-2]
MDQTNELIPHLFRTEYRKIVSVLVKLFGFARIEVAEDIASDTFLTATETWGLKGLPDNPTAWLYQVAKNKARTYWQRNSVFEKKVAPIISTFSVTDEPDVDLSSQNINDSQLQMMFALCNPVIPQEAQIGLALRILCGLGIDEIADAFLSNKEVINKRLFRAREKLREENVVLEIPQPKEITLRLGAVLSTLYLLFSEGYYSESKNTTLRKDLCWEAIYLTRFLTENEITDSPETNALLSLMYFHASRFDARTNEQGEIILYADQNPDLWDADCIQKGEYYLNRSAHGNQLTKYHMEAAIAFWHTQAVDSKEKWEIILQFYNQLLQIEYSPIAALNRTYALAKANSIQEAISEAEKLKLTDNHFYFVLLGELYEKIDRQKSIDHFYEAVRLAKTQAEKQLIQKKLDRVLAS